MAGATEVPLFRDSEDLHCQRALNAHIGDKEKSGAVSTVKPKAFRHAA